MSDQRDINDLHREGHLPDDIGVGAVDLDDWAETEARERPGVSLQEVLSIDALDDLAQIAEEPVDWLVEDIIPAAQAVLVAGPPKVGKSTFLLRLMAVLCAGRTSFAGYRTKGERTTVMWLYEDAKRTLARRVKAMDITDRFLAVGYRDAARSGISKIDPVELADALVRFAARNGAKVLVIDTLRRWFRLDENDDEQADALIAALQAAAEAENVAVVIVHHTKKLGRAKRKPTLEDVRGSCALTAAADQIVIVYRRSRGDPNAPVCLSVEGRDLEHGYDVTLERGALAGEWRRAPEKRATAAAETKLGLIEAVERVYRRTHKPVSRNAAVKELRAAGGSVSNGVAQAVLAQAVAGGLLLPSGMAFLPRGDAA